MSSPGILVDIKNVGLIAIKTVIRQIRDDVTRDPGTMLSRVILSNGKPALRIDVDAEDTFERELHTRQHRRLRNVKFYGEERLDNPNLDLGKESGICALVDTVDGTDLLERGLGNWCSAAVFFEPSAKPRLKILGAFVAVPSSNTYTTDRHSDIYYSIADDKRVYVSSTKNINSNRAVHGPSQVRSLKKASICFYGQKVEKLTSVFRQGGNPKEMATLFGYPIALPKAVVSRGNTVKEPSMRIYTLAGIPMMVKLTDHMAKKANHIDVVFDICGQNPHDVVPGAYLAMKAGAQVRRFVIERNERTGKQRVIARRMAIEDLEESLMRPAAKASQLRYLITSTGQLASQAEPFLIELIERQIVSQRH